MTKDTEHLDTSRSARRRLVRGAFAAPAMLALHSGSAFAMASNLRCVNNQLAQRVLEPANPEHYVRVELYSVTTTTVTSTGTPTTDSSRGKKEKKTKSGGSNSQVVSEATPETVVTTKYYVSGADVDALASFGRIENRFLGTGKWQEFNWDTRKLVPGAVTDVSSPTRSGKFVLIRIDGSVEGGVSIVGIVEADSASGSAVSTLCWSSFAGAAL